MFGAGLPVLALDYGPVLREILEPGADSLLLNNQDFMVSESTPKKAFEYQPFAMRTSYEFIEGYHVLHRYNCPSFALASHPKHH